VHSPILYKVDQDRSRKQADQQCSATKFVPVDCCLRRSPQHTLSVDTRTRSTVQWGLLRRISSPLSLA